MLKLNQIITGCDEALNGEGEPLEDIGCAEISIDAMIKEANRINPMKTIRVVSQWQRWDAPVTNLLILKMLEQEGIQASFIFSHHVISDTSGQVKPGYCVRSTAIISFCGPNDCIAETRNTFYILVGTGVSKTVEAKIIKSIIF